ncbi:AhpC/TSA family protein [Micromonospora purpureochromogenes]|uniref:AhpC/TSA family protein n=1 Tax=Micromonospora purpureochromogenes TaxID=47872 RepID=UPI000B5AD3C4|nr:AhpC/TSA family protein [Micromonospora purpureochromogenes]
MSADRGPHPLDQHAHPVLPTSVRYSGGVDAERLVHLQLRRFAGCPVCNLHLRSIVRQHAEIEAAGVREVVVFHSPADELRQHTEDLPFAVIADPDKRLYREFGVEPSVRALLSPRAWLPILRAVLRSSWAVLRGGEHVYDQWSVDELLRLVTSPSTLQT